MQDACIQSYNGIMLVVTDVGSGPELMRHVI